MKRNIIIILLLGITTYCFSQLPISGYGVYSFGMSQLEVRGLLGNSCQMEDTPNPSIITAQNVNIGGYMWNDAVYIFSSNGLVKMRLKNFTSGYSNYIYNGLIKNFNSNYGAYSTMTTPDFALWLQWGTVGQNQIRVSFNNINESVTLLVYQGVME